MNFISQHAPRTYSLGEIILDAKSGFASGETAEDGIVQVRMNNITQSGRLDWTKVRKVPLPRNFKNSLFVIPDDILFNATNSPELVGKSALFAGFGEPVTFSNHFIRLRVNPARADSGYVSRWLQRCWQSGVFSGMCKQWVNQASISRDQLLALEVPLPPLDEQRRTAAILDQADDLRRKRRAALERLDHLATVIFSDLFGDPLHNNKCWASDSTLGELAEIVSGVTKGRKLNGVVRRFVPYLAVANVQDRALRLAAVKSIEATQDEIDRYRLLPGDLLLTEGGDPDKLGRGTLWQGELSECIHQNHIFRVRLCSDLIQPLFLNWLVASERGKRYFLQSAKQTTGIASINMGQLRGFPILMPPVDLQRAFAARIAEIDNLKASHRAHLAKLDALFASLQHRAFRGEL